MQDFQNVKDYCKTRIFRCPVFRKFCDLGDFVKIMGANMLFLVYYLVQ